MATLVAAPGSGGGPGGSAARGSDQPLLQLGGLVNVVLPRLHAAYGAHLAGASPVSEGPVIAVLRADRLGRTAEVAGRALLADRLARGRAAGWRGRSRPMVPAH